MPASDNNPPAADRPAIDWYFDFVSPFAHLQNEILLRDHPNCKRVYHPVLFAGLLAHWGNKGPAETPAKRAAMYHYCQWFAERNEVEFRFPPAHPFNPLPALRLALAQDATARCVTAIFRAIYIDGADLNCADDLRAICRQLTVGDGAELINRQTVKDKLRANTAAAAQREVFGVPTLLIGGRCFWGLDMTEMALDYHSNPAKFNRGEYARLDKLPVGAARKLP